MHTTFDRTPTGADSGSNFGRRAGPTVRRAITALDWARAGGLLREHAAWVEAETGISMLEAQPALVNELADLSRTYGSRRSVLLVARDPDEEVCGIVAIRHHDDGSAELKRMYVQPSARGHGHASRLVREAIRYACRWRASHVWLETLPGVMDPAIVMYGKHGFRRVAAPPRLGFDGVIVMALDLRQPEPHG